MCNCGYADNWHFHTEPPPFRDKYMQGRFATIPFPLAAGKI